jgi:hypothetical protein
VFFAESHGPRALGEGNLHQGRPFAESWSLKALGEGYLHRVSYLRRERFLVLSAKSSCAESGYFGSRRRFWFTVKGPFPVVKPRCRSVPRSSRNLSPPPPPSHLTASWHGGSLRHLRGEGGRRRTAAALHLGGHCCRAAPTGRGRAAAAAVSDVKEVAARTWSPQLAKGLKNRYSSGFRIQRNRTGKPLIPSG